jgi:hypothetical protein
VQGRCSNGVKGISVAWAKHNGVAGTVLLLKAGVVVVPLLRAYLRAIRHNPDRMIEINVVCWRSTRITSSIALPRPTSDLIGIYGSTCCFSVMSLL